MKIKTTRKTINERFGKVFRAGYCDLAYIMKGEDAIYYNHGVYGWNFDVYVDYKNDIAITTGYRNMVGERIPSELIEKYTNIAKDIINKFMWEDALYTELENNRKAFFDELNNL